LPEFVSSCAVATGSLIDPVDATFEQNTAATAVRVVTALDTAPPPRSVENDRSCSTLIDDPRHPRVT